MPIGEKKDFDLSITIPTCIKDPVLKEGRCELQPPPNEDKPVNYAGGFCVVYPFRSKDGKKYAVRCWIYELQNVEERIKKVSELLANYRLPYFVEFKYVSEGIFDTKELRPIVRMEWVEGDSLNQYIYKHRKSPQTLYQLAENFLQMVCTLHEKQISHGDLQHGNIRIRENGEIVLVDYDSIYHPSMGVWSDYIHGKWEYQHPARAKNEKASERVDFFSEIIIYTSIFYFAVNPEASAYTDKIEDWDKLLFDKEDYKPENIEKSTGYRDLCNFTAETKFLAEQIARICIYCKSIDRIPKLEDVIAEGKGKGLDFNNTIVPERVDYNNDGFYIGVIRNSKRHGKGVYHWIDGSWYKGEWKNDKQHGHGIHYSTKMKRTDTGQFHSGKRVGSGVMVWENGSHYEGKWNEKGMHGQGIHYVAYDKRTDTGLFHNDKRLGSGTIKWEKGGSYKGLWDDTTGSLYGKGTYYYANGKKEKGKYVAGIWKKHIPWYTKKTAKRLIVALILISITSFLSLRTKEGFVKYNETVLQGDSIREQKGFKEAKALYQTALDEFQPRITSFIPFFVTMSKNRETEKLIDTEIKEGIEKIQIYLKADGKFVKHTEELLFDLLEFRETDEELLQYYELWKKGGNVPSDFAELIKNKR